MELLINNLQFVHDKLVNAPVDVEAREKNRIAKYSVFSALVPYKIICNHKSIFDSLVGAFRTQPIIME